MVGLKFIPMDATMVIRMREECDVWDLICTEVSLCTMEIGVITSGLIDCWIKGKTIVLMVKKGPRHTKTKLCCMKEQRCKVFFIIDYDSNSYYIRCVYGYALHNNHNYIHFKENSMSSTQMATSQQLAILRVCDKANARNCVELDLVNAQGNIKFTRGMLIIFEN